MNEADFNFKGPWLKGRPTEDPWTLPWARLSGFLYEDKVAVHHIRWVDSDRFASVPPVPPEFIGSVEVVLVHFPIPWAEIEESVFLRQDKDRWIVTSFHERMLRNNHACRCDPDSAPPNYSADNFCKGYSPKCTLFAAGIKPFPMFHADKAGKLYEIK